MDNHVQRDLNLPDDLIWKKEDRGGAVYYLTIEEDGIDITAFFVPNNRTYAWFAVHNPSIKEKAGPEYKTDGDRAPNQRVEFWIAKEIFDKLDGDEIDKFVSVAVENEIRRRYHDNDFFGWYVEKRDND